MFDGFLFCFFFCVGRGNNDVLVLPFFEGGWKETQLKPSSRVKSVPSPMCDVVDV